MAFEVVWVCCDGRWHDVEGVRCWGVIIIIPEGSSGGGGSSSKSSSKRGIYKRKESGRKDI